MSHKIVGNTLGLAPSELKQVQRLYNRKIDQHEIVSPDFAREIFSIAQKIRRRIGVLLSREGRIEEVFVGTREILYIPDIGRYRLGQGRLRRLRLIFSDLSRDPEVLKIPHDIYTDLEKLRLDAVCAVKVLGTRVMAAYAYNLPYRAGSNAVETQIITDLNRFDLDFKNFIEELETQHSQAGEVTTISNSALLVGVYELDRASAESSIRELKELARTAGLNVLDQIIQLRSPDPKTLLGKGKLEEVILRALRCGVEMIVFDTELKPSQWRAITNATNLKVIDRSMLILDIFAQHAKSADGRLQVECAQLRYNLPRLVEKDAGLSRLTGGIGGRGPGETKLEIGRRRIRDRLSELEREIDKLSKQRVLRRKERKELPLVAILGYTNVGKSTLFNVLTRSSVLVENKLFATLDPAHRRMFLRVAPSSESTDQVREGFVVVSDTVGFIRALPAELKNAFRATLEELYEADLLIHVLDASDPELESRKRAVDEILEQMGVINVPMILVLNKIDQIPSNQVDLLVTSLNAVPVSAINRQGLEELSARIAEHCLLNVSQAGKVAAISAPEQT